jgi:hypothetical protein
MKGKPISINLDEPLLSQPAVRKILKLPSTGPLPKIGLHSLLEVAKLAIRNELAAGGGSEKDLVELQLECQVAPPGSDEPEENYSVRWRKSRPAPELSNTDVVILETPPEVMATENSVSLEFVEQLSERLDEAIMQLNPVAAEEESEIITSIQTNFRTGVQVGIEYRCDPTCRDELGRICKRRYSWVGTRSVRGRCTQTPCNMSAPPPRRPPG